MRLQTWDDSSMLVCSGCTKPMGKQEDRRPGVALWHCTTPECHAFGVEFTQRLPSVTVTNAEDLQDGEPGLLPPRE